MVDDDGIEYLISCMKAAREGGETETELGRALARAYNQEYVVCRDGQWQLDAIISHIRDWRAVFCAIDPSLPSEFPAHLLDPRFLCELFSFPIGDTNAPKNIILAAAIEQLTRAAIAASETVNETFERVSEMRDVFVQATSPPPGKEWYTPTEVADLVGKTPHHIRRLLNDHRIRGQTRKGVGRGGHDEWEIHRDEVERYREHGPRPKNSC